MACGVLLKTLLRKLNHLAVVGRHKTRWPKQVGLAQTALGHLGGVVFKAEMSPHKFKRAVAVGLNQAGGHAVDLLLQDHAGKQRGHHRSGHFVFHLPPGFRHDV